MESCWIEKHPIYQYYSQLAITVVSQKIEETTKRESTNTHPTCPLPRIHLQGFQHSLPNNFNCWSSLSLYDGYLKNPMGYHQFLILDVDLRNQTTSETSSPKIPGSWISHSNQNISKSRKCCWILCWILLDLSPGFAVKGPFVNSFSHIRRGPKAHWASWKLGVTWLAPHSNPGLPQRLQDGDRRHCIFHIRYVCIYIYNCI